MSTSNSESESQRSAEEDERAENGHSHEENGNVNGNGTSGKAGKSLLTLAFPISRVRRLVKSGGDVQWVGVEAGFLIAKAAVSIMLHNVEANSDYRCEYSTLFWDIVFGIARKCVLVCIRSLMVPWFFFFCRE
jgi:hypothetical protein